MTLPDREQKLCTLIERRRGAMLDDLRELVAIPTGGNHAPGLDEIRTRLTARLNALGAITELVPGDPKPDWLYGAISGSHIPPTAVCRRRRSPSGGAEPREILLSGHLDTVHDPTGAFRVLTVAADGKTATGPGCADMKGGLVVMLAALEALEEAGIAANWTVLLNSDEETGSYCSERIITAEAARIAQSGGVGLVVEPALPDGSLVVERAGSGQFRIDIRGRAAHVGRDFASGVSAVNVLARCILDIAQLTDLSRGIIANIGPIEGGIATNVVPDHARAWGNVRFPDEVCAIEVRRRLEELVPLHGDAGGPSRERATVSILTSFIRAAKPLTPATRHLAEHAAAVAADLGQRLPFGKSAGVCDGNVMQAAGLPTIDTLGVRGGGLHTPDEWIDLSSLVDRAQLLAVLMARLADTEATMPSGPRP